MSQITIRDIPQIIEREIRRTAAEKQISLSKATILLLGESLGIGHEKKRDLSGICGIWSDAEYREFAANTEVFGKIDEEIWK